MRRILTIAHTEFLALVRTKFFIIGIIAMPVLMGGLFAFMQYAGDQVEHKDRTFAVVDRTGALYASRSWKKARRLVQRSFRPASIPPARAMKN